MNQILLYSDKELDKNWKMNADSIFIFQVTEVDFYLYSFSYSKYDIVTEWDK